MIRRGFAAIAALLTAAALAACAPQVESRIFLADVQTALSADAPVSLPATLRIPEGSEQDCTDGLSAKYQALSAIMPISRKPECIDLDGDNFSEFVTEMPVIAAGGAPPSDRLVVLEVESDAEGVPGQLGLALRLTRSLDEVVRLVSQSADGFSMTPDLDTPQFTLEIDNDTGAPVRLVPWFVYVDGEPGLPGAGDPIVIEHRRSVKLVLGDVTAAFLAEANAYRFALVALDP